MLYLIHGNDWEKGRAKAREILDSLKKKKPDAVLVSLEEGGLSEAKIEELSGSQGLFERKFIVFSDRVCADSGNAEIVKEKMPMIAKSENVFVFLEDALKVDLLKVFEKHATKVQEFKKVEKKKESFNVFSLANALRDRDRGTLWVLYQKALRADTAPEALSGILFWQIKDLLLKRSNNFSQNELSGLALRLVSIYHDAHRGLADFETGLERFVLSI